MSKIVFNPVHNEQMQLLSGEVEVVTSNPTTASDGDMIINSTDECVYLYFKETWNKLHTLTLPGYVLLETGDSVLLETGDIVLLES